MSIHPIFKFKPDQYVFNTDINTIAKDIVNYNGNRMVDLIRIDEIKQYYIDNNLDTVPGLIYAWKKSASSKLIIFDGIHRIRACLMTGINMKILLSIYNTNDENDIKKEFENINKNFHVPALYFENDVNKKKFCENFVQILCDTYPMFISTSKKPNKPNFNKNNFIEFISELNIDFTDENTSKLLDTVSELNEKAKSVNMGIKYNQKCAKYGFYLFNLERPEIKNYIENRLGNNFKIEENY